MLPVTGLCSSNMACSLAKGKQDYAFLAISFSGGGTLSDPWGKAVPKPSKRRHWGTPLSMRDEAGTKHLDNFKLEGLIVHIRMPTDATERQKFNQLTDNHKKH